VELSSIKTLSPRKQLTKGRAKLDLMTVIEKKSTIEIAGCEIMQMWRSEWRLRSDFDYFQNESPFHPID
jgi:hypothetical protein